MESITAGWTPETLEELAIAEITFDTLIKRAGIKMTKGNKNPWTDYLLDLSQKDYIDLIREVSEAHADVLDRYPAFAESLTQSLRAMV